MKRAILFVTFAALCGAQTTVNGGRDYKGTLKASGSVSGVDFSGAGSTAPVKAGTSATRPTACTQGQIYFATDVAAGQNLYFCTVTGAPGVWSQMTGSAAGAMTAGAGAPAGGCAPPALYVDTTNQDLWYCSATNTWKKPTADTSGFPTLSGANSWTGTNTLSGGQFRATGGGTVIDLSGAASTAPAKSGTTAARPSACTQGQIYFSTDAAAGQNLYFCTTTGAPGTWTQMSGATQTTATAGAGAPGGNCTPPLVYIDTTNQELWYCGATNTWNKPTTDTSGFPTLAGVNTWTGYSNASAGQWRPPESTVANLPPAGSNLGKVFMVTDAVTAGSCSAGGGSLRELCRANGSAYECVGGCGSTGGGGSGSPPYMSLLLTGPDLTRTITGVTHGFATTALLVAVYDNATPRNAISAGWTVNPSSYDVAISFAVPQSNYYVVINGGVGPAGPTGPAGPAGPPGASGTGGGNVSVAATTLASRIATFADATGTLIQDSTEHSIGGGYLSVTKTAGSGGVTAKLLCKLDGAANVVLPSASEDGALGVCVTTQAASQAVEVATRGVVSCVADNSTTPGNLVVAGSATAGRCRDSGQSLTSGVPVSTQILGRVLTAASAGSPASIELYGPGHYGAAVRVADGGTGQATYNKGDLLTTPGGANLSRLAAGGDGQVLTADAAATVGVRWAGSNRRVCVIDNDTQSSTPLTAAQITGRCEIPFAAHIVEVGVWGGTGAGTQTYGGTSSIQLTRVRPNGGSTAAVLSGAMGTPGGSSNANKACATATTGSACFNGLASSSTVTLAAGAAVPVSAGDVVFVSSATADGVQTWYTITIVYTAD